MHDFVFFFHTTLLLFHNANCHLLAFFPSQPLLLWRRYAKLVQLLVGVCITLRSYAIEAGFLENYMVNVVRSKGGKKGQELEDLSFNLKDFKIKKEVI